MNILVAIRWVTKAWLAVKETTVCKCFRKADILDSSLNVVSCDLDDKDPFLATDESMALQGLIETTMTGTDHCPLEEYVNGENEVPVCLDASSELWEEEFFVSLGREDKDDDDADEDQESEEPSQEPPPQSKLNIYKEAISSLEDIQLFLDKKSRAC